MTDQQVLIAFGPYVRNSNVDAIAIHQRYLSTHDQGRFLTDARCFLDNMMQSNNDDANANDVQSVVEKIAAQVEEVVKAASEMNVGPPRAAVDNGREVTGPPPGILPPPGLHPLSANESNSIPSIDSSASMPQSTLESSNSSTANSNAPTSILPTPIKESHEPTPPTAAAAAKIKIRRTQTRLSEQPGKLFANGISPDASDPNNSALTVRLRTEVSARWVLPLKHLRERVLRRQPIEGSAQNLTIRDALQHLTVGLFRYGAADNGSHCSIVSKEILSDEASDKDHPFDVDTASDCIYGTVPFFSPRTPGNVVFRLYFEDEPHVTLATGPMLKAVPDDSSSVLRFILSNFKGKKTNGLSSIHSFASVMEVFAPNGESDEAGRAAWGCICETRKLVEAAGVSYTKKKMELEEAERELEEVENVRKELTEMAEKNDLVVKVKEDEEQNKEGGGNDERTKLMGERYTNERKWKEMQLAYAMLLEVS
jgi:hypothetical protein